MIARQTGACFVTSTKNIAPADKKIYALRDKINAMSIPLIASSIMSKKIASGAKNLVLDVKYGSGAFIKSKTQALVLARLMKKIGIAHGIKTSYVLGEMNQPLGRFVGDVLEVKEVLSTLQNPKDSRLLSHSLNLVAQGLYKPLNQTKQQVYDKAYQFVKSGMALQKLKEIVLAQGGKFDIIEKEFFPKYSVLSNKNGIIKSVNTKEIGFLEKHLKETTNNYLGFEICVELGQKVKKGEPLFELYFESETITEIKHKFLNLIRIKNETRNHIKK